MPELVTYRGHPVKRRNRVPGGLRLILVHPQYGKAGVQITVTQRDWEQYGRVEFYPKDKMPDLRALATRALFSSSTTS